MPSKNNEPLHIRAGHLMGWNISAYNISSGDTLLYWTGTGAEERSLSEFRPDINGSDFKELFRKVIDKNLSSDFFYNVWKVFPTSEYYGKIMASDWVLLADYETLCLCAVEVLEDLEDLRGGFYERS